MVDKVIVVEGSSDKNRLALLLDEPVDIICTNGTASPTRIEELLEPYEGADIFAFFDADRSGERLRALLRREYPEARHLYTDRVYREVATTPLRVLAEELLSANIEIKTEFLL